MTTIIRISCLFTYIIYNFTNYWVHRNTHREEKYMYISFCSTKLLIVNIALKFSPNIQCSVLLLCSFTQVIMDIVSPALRMLSVGDKLWPLLSCDASKRRMCDTICLVCTSIYLCWNVTEKLLYKNYTLSLYSRNFQADYLIYFMHAL